MSKTVENIKMNTALDTQNLDLDTALLELRAAVLELDTLGATVARQRAEIERLRDIAKSLLKDAEWLAVSRGFRPTDFDNIREAQEALEGSK